MGSPVPHTPPTPPTPPDDWLLWQLADASFPTGGFAHSAGLEAAWQHGLTRDAASFETFLREGLRQTRHAALPFVAEAHRSPDRFADLDAACDAFLSNHVARRASTRQGQAWLATVAATFDTPDLADFRTRVRAAATPCHLAPAFGVTLRRLGVDAPAACRLFVFLALRGWVSSAVRLGVVGSLAAQAIQRRVAPLADAAAEGAHRFTLDNLAQTAPLLDILHATQDRLYSRLFQS